MTTSHQQMIDAAIRDLENRTLPAVPGDIAKLVYLSSTKDYNTGRYHHQGLNAHFTAEAAEAALARCHQGVFQALLAIGLAQLVEELDRYLQVGGDAPGQVLESWQTLQPYRMLVPASADPLGADFFISNVTIALAVLMARAKNRAAPAEASTALLLQ